MLQKKPSAAVLFMYNIIFLFNALCDLKEQYIYSYAAKLQLIVSFFYFTEESPLVLAVMGLFLLILRIYDTGEEFMGHGDYPVILSLSIYHGLLITGDLLIASLLMILSSLIIKKDRYPLLPYLFSASLISEFIALRSINIFYMP